MADDEKKSRDKLGVEYSPTPISQYAVYDMVERNHPLAYFDRLTGGEQQISMVSYNVTDDKGNVTTKYMPGQTSFSPVTLLRPNDKWCMEIKNRFVKSTSGMLVGLRKNYSISMNDSNGTALVWWHLIDALPTVLGGLGFNSYRGTESTTFKVTFQAESILVQFEPIADDPLP